MKPALSKNAKVFRIRSDYKHYPTNRNVLGDSGIKKMEEVTGFKVEHARWSFLDGWVWCWFEDRYEKGSGGPPMVNCNSGQVRFR